MHYAHTLKGHSGKPCPYCTRRMEISSRHLCPTRDHYPIPKSRGGRRIIIVCHTCNHLKGDKSAEAWATFMLENKSGWFNMRLPSAGLPEDPQQPLRPPALAVVLPYAESIMILKHGKRAWREWKARQSSATPHSP